MTRRIYFFYPSRTVGGAQLLFIRLARILSANPGLDIGVIDYEDGFLTKSLSATPVVTIYPYKPGAQIVLPRDTTVVTPPSFISDLHIIFRLDAENKTSFLFWSIQARNVEAAFLDKWRGIFSQKKQILPPLLELLNSGSVLFMDKPNYLGARSFVAQDFNYSFLPIPFEVPEQVAPLTPLSPGQINIGWLGRISFEKVSAILDIIDQIAAIQDQISQMVTFHIIGDGPKKNIVTAYAEEKKVQCVFPGVLQGETLGEYLVTSVDIGVAMGTSCMEIAAKKIPSVLLDFSYKKFPKSVKYRWLYETEEFALGQEISLPNTRSHTFLDIISIMQTGRKAETGNKCYEYIKKYHDISNIGTLLVSYIDSVRQIQQRPALLAIYKAANPLFYRYGIKPAYNLFTAAKTFIRRAFRY